MPAPEIPFLAPLDDNPPRLHFCDERCRGAFQARCKYTGFEFDIYLRRPGEGWPWPCSPDRGAGLQGTTSMGNSHLPCTYGPDGRGPAHVIRHLERPGPIVCPQCGGEFVAVLHPWCAQCDTPLSIVGRRCGGLPVVTAGLDWLDPRFDLADHSPTGFEWGDGGSGPAQLALAVLAHALSEPVSSTTLRPAALQHPAHAHRPLRPEQLLEHERQFTPFLLATYQDFKAQVIATIPHGQPWILRAIDVRSWARATEERRPHVARFIHEVIAEFGARHIASLWRRASRLTLFLERDMPNFAQEERRLLAELDPRPAEQVLADLHQDPAYVEFAAARERQAQEDLAAVNHMDEPSLRPEHVAAALDEEPARVK